MGYENISIRMVKQTDMVDVVQLLQSISNFNPSKNDFNQIWHNLLQQNNVHSLIAIIGKKIVGYGSIIIETKIRGGKMGHIEDIVAHPNHRKQGIGKLIVNALFEVAKANDCYKVALQCKEHKIEFYEKCNYEISGVAMQRFIN
jgi:glucosamine-phosphate N-acetyltransferase